MNEIKFNSVDRVGNKRSGGGHGVERTIKVVNGGGCGITGEQLASSKAAIDSTRVSADQLVQQLLADNKLAEALSEESPCFGDDSAGGEGGGLALYVGKDGSATIGSRSARQVAAMDAVDGSHHHGSMTFVAVRGGSGSTAPGSRSSSGSNTPNRKLNRV